jgi:energy-coupling factor transporter ATP-binding protein EcfA2
VRGLDLAIRPGERILLLGASGAGKSTLLAAIAGVLGGDDDGESEGSLLVGGLGPAASRGAVGLLLQDPDSQVVLARIGDDVAFGCENLGVPRDEIWRRVGESLAAVGLDLPVDHPTGSLSGGQKQRLALAGILAMRPSLILLDEPTANLDPDGVIEVRDAVARVAANTGSTLVIVEHRVEIWWRLVDRVVVLAPGGGVLADGAPDVVLAEQGAALAASGVWVPGHEPVVGSDPVAADTVGGGLVASGPVAAVPVAAVPVAADPVAADPVAAGREVLHAERLAIARTKDAVIQSGISLTLRAGRCLAISGPNGSGKSTLGLTLGGLLASASGSVTAPSLSADLKSDQPLRWKSSELVSRIGTVFQDPEHQFVSATVRGELEVGAKAVGLSPAETDARISELVTRLRLDQLLDANPFTLSGGEKRRLSVATALVTRPAVLVLDEPTFGQDARTWAELVALIVELLSAGSAIVAVTHDERFIDAVADERLHLAPVGVSE